MKPVPPLVAAAEMRAAEHDFGHSCQQGVGELLSFLATTTPPSGRILELGTGFGVGLAWILTGLGSRIDVEVVTIERDAERVASLAEADLPSHASIVEGDIEALLPTLGQFDLIFADAEAGKWTGLELTISALAPRALLLVDDMDNSHYGSSHDRSTVEAVRKALMTDPRLTAVELNASSGMILASRRAEEL
ncbi:O-methyltransferase [Candidatus Poriferisocius sp.]|uniref:O-methyltransferase n=1 Tax=Candidatus Poriferisocius sp. TaxID=3101276 RepID=UPI003B012E3C